MLKPKRITQLLSAVLLTFLLASAPSVNAQEPQAELPKDIFSLQSEGKREADPRIIGGDPANPDDWPFFVSLGRGPASVYNMPFCGGSLIHPNWVLTAAHCVDAIDFAPTVTISRPDLEEATGQTRKVEGIYIYSGYDGFETYSGDAALLYFSDPLDVTTAVLPENTPAEDVLARVAGFGATEYSDGSAELLDVDVRTVSDEYCSYAYGESFIAENMFCAGDDGRDSCYGDSGGPLTVGGQLQGIVSWGSDCADPDFPGVYSRVTYFRPWIDSALAGTRPKGQLRGLAMYSPDYSHRFLFLTANTQIAKKTEIRFLNRSVCSGKRCWKKGRKLTLKRSTLLNYRYLRFANKNRRCANVVLRTTFPGQEGTDVDKLRICMSYE